MAKKKKTGVVTISNNFLKSDYVMNKTLELSVQQKRFIYYLISRVKPTDTEFYDQQIPIADYCFLFGLDKYTSRSRQVLKDSLADLGKKAFWYKPYPDKDIEDYLRWLDKIRIDYTKGQIEVRLGGGLKDYLLQLKNNYTQWEIGYTTRFKCTYSFSLYHLFAKWLMNYKNRTFYVSISDLRTYLLSGRDMYPVWADFKRRCIDPAIEEINKYTNFNVTYNTDRTQEDGTEGKKITNVCFIVAEKTGEEYDKVSEWKNTVGMSPSYLALSKKISQMATEEKQTEENILDTSGFQGKSYESLLDIEDPNIDITVDDD